MRYRAPFATERTDLDLDTAMDMVVDRVLDSRTRGWQHTDEQGAPDFTAGHIRLDRRRRAM